MTIPFLTVMQTTGVFCAYLVMTLILPAILLYQKIKDRVFAIRFMTYLAVGNFFMMSLVLILQLLHISNRVTLTVFTVFIFLALFMLVYRTGHRWGLLLKQIGQNIRKCFACVWRRFCSNKLDSLLTFILIVAVLVMSGRNVFMQLGSGSSDLAVYDYWIRAMDQGELFVDGVFQFGFCCVIYYLHQVFWIDTYVLLRLFWIVQILLIHLLLLAFIRMCCKLKYIAYVGLGIYMFLEVFVDHAYTRYSSLLPQFGMIFILPSIGFLFLFFEQKNRELYTRKHEKQEKQDTWKPQLQEEEERVYLLDDVLAESAAREAAGQTFAAQPEDEQPEAILTIERNEKDGSLFIKTAPLGIQNKKQKDATKQGPCKRAGNTLKREFSLESSQYLILFALNLSMALTVPSYHIMIAGIFCLGAAFGFFFRLLHPQYFLRIVCAGVLAIAIFVFAVLVAHNGEVLLQDSMQWGMAVMERAQEDTKTLVTDKNYELIKLHEIVFLSGPTVVSISIALLFVLAVLHFILKQTDYAAKLMAVAVYMALMTLLFIAPGLGVPKLMDGEGRTYIYYAYSMVFAWILCADGIWNINVTVHGSKCISR